MALTLQRRWLGETDPVLWRAGHEDQIDRESFQAPEPAGPSAR